MTDYQIVLLSLRQDHVAGLFYEPASNSLAFAKSEIPSFSGLPRMVLADLQARPRTGGFCFMATGEKHGNWNGGRRLSSHGYVLIHVGKDHPVGMKNGYAYEHRLKAWEAGHDIGGKEVHHEDEIKTCNDSDNLNVLTPHEHRSQHRSPDSKRRLPDEPNIVIPCECGCGESLLKYDNDNRPRRYIYGHHRRGKKLIRLQRTNG